LRAMLRWRKGKGKKLARIYTVKYWSTRKEGDIYEAYGETDSNHIRDALKASKELQSREDVYFIEVWKRVGTFEREKIVEEFHGNEAHLSLKNSRKAKTHGKSQRETAGP